MNQHTTEEKAGKYTFICVFTLLAVLHSGSISFPAGKDRIDLLVTGGTIVTMDPSRRILEDGAVAVQGQRILDIGSSRDLGSRYTAGRVISARGRIVLPGLINAHNHAPMVLFRGIADDLDLKIWLEKHIFPLEARNVTKDFVEWGTALACAEMIRSGTTTYADMYYFEDQIAEVTARAGMRAVLGETILQSAAPDNKTLQDALAYTEGFLKRWKAHPLIVPAVAPHAPYTNNAESIRASKALADRYGVPLMIHVSETQDEVRQSMEQYGRTPARWLEDLNFFNECVLLNHGVWLNEEDLQIIKRHGVSIAHNPESNMKLASGTAPVPRMLALGINVALGTDGAASNNNLDMFQAMDFAAKLHKLAAMDPTALPAARVLEMATVNGARALGLERETGSLEKGKKADFILVDAEQAHIQPLYNVYSQLVYAARGSDVRTSVIDGRIVMLDGKLLSIDEKLVMHKVREYRQRIVGSKQ